MNLKLKNVLRPSLAFRDCCSLSSYHRGKPVAVVSDGKGYFRENRTGDAQTPLRLIAYALPENHVVYHVTLLSSGLFLECSQNFL